MVTRLKDTLLLVGSNDSARPELREIFSSSFDILEAENAIQAALLLEQNRSCIVATIADVPIHADNLSTLSAASGKDVEKGIPLVVLLPSHHDTQQEEWIFELGATDVAYKPFSPMAILRRVQILVDLYLHKWNLEKLVTEQSTAIRNTNQVMLDALSAIIEHRSTESGNHILRIRRFTKILLEEVARNCPEYQLNDHVIDIISGAAALHDIGKISIPDAILNKPGRLTPEEFATMKNHTVVGSEMIQNLSGMGDTAYLRYAYNICLYHHERWDGHGYPMGLKGDEIPICAQVVAIADVFDALTSPRVYKPALSCDRAINMILNGECGVFSPRLLTCFKNVRPLYVALANEYSDGLLPKSDDITMPLPGPVWKSSSLTSLQMMQLKYQTLLHYLDDTVLELDLDNRLYHVVYNPNPDMDALVPNAASDGMLDQLGKSVVHPDDRPSMEEMDTLLKGDFFTQNLRRKVFYCRIFSPVEQKYVPYELTFLRVNTGNMEQRIVIAIWHRTEGFQQRPRNNIQESPALYGLENCILRCRSNAVMTLDTGMDNLYPLTGYTSNEVMEIFGGNLLPMVVQEDHSVLLDALREGRQTGAMQNLDFRLLKKDGSTVWVQDRSRVYIDEDEQEYVYHVLNDNSRDQAACLALKKDLERDQLIFQQMDSLVFELDVINDYMYSSPKWEEHFGYTPRAKNFMSELSHSHFHPDDLSAIRKMVSDLKQGAPSATVEVRLINHLGKYIWCSFGGTGQYDEEGRLLKIVGLITDIDAMKRATLSLREKAERDPLTKLFNKESTQNLVTEHLENRESSLMDAIIMLDLDNFKAVNDNYGHLFGDAILTQLSNHLRRLFRPHDLIGRIGGDEFLILLKNITDEAFLKDRCELLLSNCRQLMDDIAPDLNCSWSIGVAIAPLHGTTYQELFKRADEALYTAKNSGKNTYRIYDDQAVLDTIVHTGTHTLTRIDSDDQPGMADSSFLRFVFHRLYESHDPEATIQELLAYIGREINASRVYIFENNEDNTACSNTFEWCNTGIVPQIDFLQDISYITDLPGWPQVFDERGMFYCSDINTLPAHIRCIVEPQGIKSLVLCAIMDKGVFRGYVGFDECNVNRMWTESQISLLEFLSELLAVFLLKQRNQDKAQRQASNLTSVLNNQDAWIYVIDPQSYTLRFVNDKLLQFAPGCQPGQLCYKTITGRDQPCDGCPAVNILKDKTASAVVYNRNFGVRAQASATHVNWDGGDACLLTCRETTL